MSIPALLRLYLPAIIPSWRFFREIAPSPRVEVLRRGQWQEVMPPPARVSPGQMLWRLLWNPQRNAALYLNSLSERVVETGSQRALAELQARVARQFPGEALRLRLVFVAREEGVGLSREVLHETPPFGGA